MKRLITFLIVIVAILVIFDFLLGYVIGTYIKKNGLRGDYGSIEYVMNKCEDDVLFIGSSVVRNSLMPLVLEDSLGLSCYNAGANFQTMPYFQTILNLVLQRYTPKMIILGLRPDELSDNDIGRYQLLVPYYHMGYNEIDSVLESKNKYERYFLKSNLYRYNTIWFRILLYHFMRGNVGRNGSKNKGFSGHGKPPFPPYMTESIGCQDVSDTKVRIFDKIISTCKQRGIILIVYSPPMYTNYERKTSTVEELERICQEKRVPYFYDTQDSLFLVHQEWFYDNIHLNKYGALEYSKIFATRINHLKSKYERNK